MVKADACINRVSKVAFRNLYADKLGSTKKEAAVQIDTLFEVIGDLLVDGKTLSYPGFGCFVQRTRAARIGKNSFTGQLDYNFKESHSVGFRVAKKLKTRLG